MAAHFYIYQFVDIDGRIAYIGKGSGHRFAVQKRRFSELLGSITQWFGSEAAAYKTETRLIQLHKPYLNKAPGGRGGILGSQLSKEERQMKKIGKRLFIARSLLKFDLTGHLRPFEIHQMRLIADFHTYLD